MVQSIDDARRRQGRGAGGGRVPPHDLAAEESLLGAMLLSKDAISTASMACAADDFYKPAHAHIFDAIVSLQAQGEPADPVTVAAELRRLGLLEAIGGPAVLVTLQAKTPATSNAASYAKIVTEHALLRRLIGVAGEIAEIGYGGPDDVTAAIDIAETMVFQVADRRSTDTTAVLRDLLGLSLDRINALYDKGDAITGIPTGYYEIDDKLSGLQKSSLVIIGARPAMGKALALDTPLPTPAGWSTMGDIGVGETVFDEAGQPCRVTYCSPVFLGHTCYRVTFDDGASIVADAGHRWLADDLPAWKSRRARTRRMELGPPAYPTLARDQSARHKLPRVVTTAEMLDEGVRRGGRPNWYVRLADPLDLPDADLPVDPYVLGCWLGDGTSTGSDLTIGDVTRELQAAGLLAGAAKHIPATYLRAGRKQRLELLQGLLDTADTVTNANGTVELCLANHHLLAQAREVVLSLGHKPGPIRRRAIPLGDGRSATGWRFRWTPLDPVFRMPRKADRLASTASTRINGRHTRRAIVAIEAVSSVPVRCIAVDSPAHLFLAGEAMIPTHNTSLALGMAAHAAVTRNTPVLFFSLEMGHLEITQRLLCSEAMVDSSRLRNGRLLEGDWPRITAATSRLAEAQLYIDDNPNLTIMEVRAKARRLKSRLGELGLIVIDYLQLMTGRHNAESRQVEIAEMSRGLKILARELEVPVVALSQLSRQLESRQDKRPMLSDLRESGCVTGDTRIRRADTGVEVTISELLVSGEQDVPVWTVDSDHQLVAGVMSKVFPSGIKPVFALQLASGRTVKASANHPFLTPDGWRRLDELTLASRVAVPHRTPAPLTTRPWRDGEVVLLAHLLGDAVGSVRRPLACRTPDEAVVAEVRAAARSFGVHARVRREGNWASIQLSPEDPAAPDPVWDWLEGLGLAGLRCREKFVPPAVAQLPRRQLALFLRHLWAGSGALGWHNGKVDMSVVVADRRMAEDVQGLLSRFEIWSRIGEAGPDHNGAALWQVVVEGATSQRRFLDDIGALGVHIRRVPLLLTKLAAAAPAVVELTDRSGRRGSGDGSHPTIGYVRAHATATVTQAAEDRDLTWDRIVAIDPLGEEPVYDATVEGTHNFLANGVVVHNSLEQDADVVMFIYRDEIYNAETNDKGAAEVIIAKHRNGPTGTTRLVFQDRYTRFDNAARS